MVYFGKHLCRVIMPQHEWKQLFLGPVNDRMALRHARLRTDNLYKIGGGDYGADYLILIDDDCELVQVLGRYEYSYSPEGLITEQRIVPELNWDWVRSKWETKYHRGRLRYMRGLDPYGPDTYGMDNRAELLFLEEPKHG